MQGLIEQTVIAVIRHLDENGYPEAAGMLDPKIYRHQPTGLGRRFEAQLNGLAEDNRVRTTRAKRLDEIAGVSRRTWVANVISLVPADEDNADSGVFVLEIRRSGEADEDGESLWTTVVRGNHDGWNFYTSRYAILHALAQDTAAMDRGAKSDHGTAAAYAGRVLGFEPDE